MRIRQACVFDIEQIAPLFDAYREFYAQTSDIRRAREFLHERFAHHESIILIALDEFGSVIGFVQLYPLFSSVRGVRTYVLNDLFVAKHARRARVGRQLVVAATDFARANGAASLSLQTAVDNESAQSLYTSLGWKRDDRFYEYSLPL
jgi:ribosomal protein S18 acetylase RimI-like enzyme